MSFISITSLATQAGVKTSTVRFYERQGLIVPDDRSAANYRLYSPASLERLRFIKAAQATGFSLSDVRQLLSFTGSDEPPCDEILALMQRRLMELRERITELKRLETALSKSLEGCCKGTEVDVCREVVRLGGHGDCSTKARRKIRVGA